MVTLGPIKITSILTNFTKSQKSADGKVYRSSTISRAFNCEKSLATLTSFVLFPEPDGQGKPVALGSAREASAVLPDEKLQSTDPGLLELGCPAGDTAEQWSRVSSSADREIFIGKQPMMVLGPIKITNILINFAKSQKTPEGKVYRSSVISRAFDCKDSIATLVSFLLYPESDAKGEPVVIGSDQEAASILPDEEPRSTDPGLLELGCRAETQRD
jgi:hypothetical protein